MSISASEIVSVTPSVLGAGGEAVSLAGLMLTNSSRVPINTVISLPTTDAVSAYFGPSSTEATLADVYFGGFVNSDDTPNALLFAQYPQVPVAAYLRGASLATMSLAQLQAIKPATITGSIGGTVTASIGASFTGSASGVTLTASSTVGIISIGDVVAGTGIPANTFIVDGPTGGGDGDYTTSQATTASSASCTTTSTVLDVTAVGAGSVQTGDVLSGSGVTVGTTVTGQLTGSAGSTGTYRVSAAQSVASESITATSATMKVTAQSVGLITTNMLITGSGVTASSRVTGQISGTTGGVGLYSLSESSHVSSEALVGAYDISVTVNGSPATSASVNLSAATSFSAAATTIGSAIGETVTFDSVSSAFVVTSPTTGSASTIGFGSGALSSALNLTLARNAVTSQGANAATPGSFMDTLITLSQAWAAFMTTFDPDNSGNANKLLFAAWVNGKSDRFGYAAWDVDTAPTLSNAATSSLGYILKNTSSSGTEVIYNSASLAAFVLSVGASLDFTRTKGRATWAFRAQTGLAPTVTDPTVAANLRANGYNYYGQYAENALGWEFYYPGTITGPFDWADSYFNQIQLNASLQAALMDFLTTVKSTPFTQAGAAQIAQVLADPINAGINFGSIVVGVTLSSAQIAEVNAAAGANVAPALTAQGWYLQIKVPSPSVRATRGPWPITFWYCDGGSVQSIDLSSATVQ
jgi:hypothetical protein